MYPVLLHLEYAGWSLTLPAYGTCMALAVLTIVGVGWMLACRRGLPAVASLTIIVAMAAAIPLGARIGFGMLHGEIGRELLDSPMLGFYLPVGLTASFLLGALLARLLRLDFWKLADALAPGLGLGCAIMRLGCFCNGCCFGKPTALPWGVKFPAGSPVHHYQALENMDRLFHGPVPVHPTQLYDAAAGIVVAVIAITLWRRRVADGVPTLAAAAWFILFRWFNSYLRAPDPRLIWPVGVSAMFYAFFLALVAGLLAYRLRRAIDVRNL